AAFHFAQNDTASKCGCSTKPLSQNADSERAALRTLAGQATGPPMISRPTALVAGASPGDAAG
ncbi:MAG: hypothetical protein ACE5O2_00335, partial [Armatimonadota bacterium]